jgi:hypothetical protein
LKLVGREALPRAAEFEFGFEVEFEFPAEAGAFVVFVAFVVEAGVVVPAVEGVLEPPPAAPETAAGAVGLAEAPLAGLEAPTCMPGAATVPVALWPAGAR